MPGVCPYSDITERAVTEKRGIGQAELACCICVSKNTMNMIEESKMADPRFSRVLAIARQLGMSLDALAHGASPPTPDKLRGRKAQEASV